MATIFKRGTTWWISYYDGGKRVRKSLNTESKRVAERERMAIEGKLVEPKRHVKREKNSEVAVFWEAYLERERDHLRPNTITIQTHFWNQVTGYLKPNRLSDITPDGLEAFKRWRLSEGNSERTINNAIADMHSIFEKAIAMNHYTGKNPAKRVRRYKLTKKMPEFHTEEELKGLLEASSPNIS
jgi:site-specific recombinase XerD